MVTDTFPALALALEPGDADVMARPPRNPAEALLSRQFLVSVLFYGALITAATLGAFLLYADGPRTPGADDRVHDAGIRPAVSPWERPERKSPVLNAKRALANPYAIGALALSIALQLLTVYVDPLARILGVVPPAARDWLLIVSFALVPAVVGQAIKLAQRSR